ncbi:MAG: hypothetical protein ACREX9_21395, partial [Gammaproteobacteria bacterium]
MLDELHTQSLDRSIYYLDPDRCGETVELLNSYCRKLHDGYKRGRAPLIIVGAGVSRPPPAEIPLMEDLLDHIIGLTSQEDPADEVVKLCDRAKTTRNRSDVAILFGALQNPLTDLAVARRVWKQFCDDFLSRKVKCGGQDLNESSIKLRPEPTEAHRWIAEMCVTYGARCLSVNFDGLTRRAIDGHVGRDGKGVILDTQRKIDNFFARAPHPGNGKPLYAVFKVRGDIFYAKCQTSGCPLESDETPVYDLDSYAKKSGDGRSSSGSLLGCPECGEPRTLQIGFPGHHGKELESEKILASLWRFVVPSRSMFILLGFSGEWDRAVVNFVFEAGRSQSIPILDVRLEPKEGAKHFIHDVGRIEYADVEYKGLYGTADRFAELMKRTGIDKHKQLKTPSVPNPTHIGEFGAPMPADETWHKEPWTSPHGSAHICSAGELRDLSFFS